MNENTRWYKLDNDAIIVPCSAKGSDTRVFRIVGELKEDVDPVILQRALDETLLEFPHLGCALRKGLFWYYLDPINERAVVTEDVLPPLAPLYYPGRRSLLYRVSYCGRRINLEMFHVLADGSGAFMFFQKMLLRYLSYAHDIKITGAEDVSSAGERGANAFDRYYREEEKKSSQLRDMTSVRAYQLRGEKDENMQNHLIEGIVPSDAFLSAAHGYGTTAGVLVASVFAAAVADGMSMRERESPVVLSVPVDLRRFFPSYTTRNFFGVIKVTWDAHGYDGTLESVIPDVSKSFEEQLTQESIRRTMNSYSRLVRNYAVKAVPLVLKEPVIGLYLSKMHKGVTASVSNVGVIRVPKEAEKYIDHFAGFMTAPTMQLTVVSGMGKMVFGSAEPFTDHALMLRFYRHLVALGMKPEIATNDYNA